MVLRVDKNTLMPYQNDGFSGYFNPATGEIYGENDPRLSEQALSWEQLLPRLNQSTGGPLSLADVVKLAGDSPGGSVEVGTGGYRLYRPGETLAQQMNPGVDFGGYNGIVGAEYVPDYAAARRAADTGGGLLEIGTNALLGSLLAGAAGFGPMAPTQAAAPVTTATVTPVGEAAAGAGAGASSAANAASVATGTGFPISGYDSIIGITPQDIVNAQAAFNPNAVSGALTGLDLTGGGASELTDWLQQNVTIDGQAMSSPTPTPTPAPAPAPPVSNYTPGSILDNPPPVSNYNPGSVMDASLNRGAGIRDFLTNTLGISPETAATVAGGISNLGTAISNNPMQAASLAMMAGGLLDKKLNQPQEETYTPAPVNQDIVRRYGGVPAMPQINYQPLTPQGFQNVDMPQGLLAQRLTRMRGGLL